MENPELCIDTLGANANWQSPEHVGLYECWDDLKNPGFRQAFRLRNHRDISIDGTNSECLDSNHGKILVYGCSFKQANQYFRYDLDSKQIFCGPKSDNICIDMDPTLETVLTSTCNSEKMSQKWNWGFTNETMLRNWVQFGKEIIDKDELEDLTTF